jgi:hypothetical protein
MPDYTYAAAGTVAPSVLAHLTLHLNAARERGEDGFAMLPDERAITRMIDTAFWASLRREEGTEPKISLAFLTREQALNPLVFERSVPLEPAALTRLSAVVERRGIHLGIAYQGGDLLAWGIVRTIPKYCCVIEVACVAATGADFSATIVVGGCGSPSLVSVLRNATSAACSPLSSDKRRVRSRGKVGRSVTPPA